MPTPNRMKGYGCSLGYATTVGGAYTTLSDLSEITPPEVKAAAVKNSALDFATATHAFQKGWITPGELGAVLYLTKTQFNTLLGFLTAGTEYFWKVTFPLMSGESTASKMTFPGFVSSVKVDKIDISDDNLVMVPITMTLNDVPTFTPGS